MRLRVAPFLTVALIAACSPLPLADAGVTGGSGGSAGGGIGSGGGGGGDGGAPAVDAGVPEKIIFLLEDSQSWSVTDPQASRVTSFASALDSLPNDPRISIAVIAFSGSSTAILNSQLFEFTPLTQLTPTARATMLAQLTNFAWPGTDRRRDWVRALSDLYAFLYRDTMEVLTLGEPLARYTVIFVSDGAPTVNQDDHLLCGDAVARLRWLQTSALDVRFHTVHMFLPTQPLTTTCTQDAGIVAGTCALPTITLPVCPILQIDTDAERLRRMAVIGGGRALDVRSGAVDFAPLFQ